MPSLGNVSAATGTRNIVCVFEFANMPSSPGSSVASAVTLVRNDQDANVGVQGAAPTDGSAHSYYQEDDLHLAAAGYAHLDHGSNGFGAAVQARLEA